MSVWPCVCVSVSTCLCVHVSCVSMCLYVCVYMTASLLLLQVHGCLLQAKLLLEINAQTVDTAPLLHALLPLLQSTPQLMHPAHPCAPIRNEATLLAAAVVALPHLPQTAPMASLLLHIRQSSWLAVAQSCRDQDPNKQQQPVASASRESGDGVRGVDPRGGANDVPPLLYEAGDPMTCLWLKNAAVLLFGRGLSLALGRCGASREDQQKSGLREEEVRTAMGSRSYDVPGGCLKACILRAQSGMCTAAAKQ